MIYKLNKISLQYIILLCLSAGTIIFVIYPSISNIKLAQKSLQQKQTDLINNTEKYEYLKLSSKDQVKMDEISKKVLSLYPDDKDVSNFIINLEKLAQSENLTFNNLSISEPKSTSKNAAGSTNSIQFEFNTDGSYDQITNVIKKLEQFNRANSLNTVNISVKDQNIVSLKVTGFIYYGK